MNINENLLEEILFENCEGLVRKKGEWNARCPFCGDSRKSKRIKRFYVFYHAPYDSWLYKCYNGGCDANQSGDVFALVSHLKGVTYAQAKKLLIEDEYDPNSIKKKLNGEKKTVEEKPNQSGKLDLDLKLECYSIHDEPSDRIGKRYVEALRKFVTERKVPIECFVAHSGRYKSRIIIPIYINGKMVYFQARSIDDSLEPKYLNPIVEKEHHILNVDNFDRSKYIIVTEGLLDALMVNYNQGTTVLGGQINDDFLKILFLYTDKGIIMAGDNWKIDKAAKKELERFIGMKKTKNVTPSFYCQKVKYFIMPDEYKHIKDLNQLKMETDIEDVYDFVVKNSYEYFNLLVKLKM